MAFVINPDGTIKILEVKYDRSGNISPKRIIEGTKTPLHSSQRKRRINTGLLLRYRLLLIVQRRMSWALIIP